MLYNYVTKNLILCFILVLLFYGELTIYGTEIEYNYDMCEFTDLKYWERCCVNPAPIVVLFYVTLLPIDIIVNKLWKDVNMLRYNN